jgi:hypothetical protein
MLRHCILTPAPPGSQDKLEQALKTSRSEAQKKDRVQQRLRVIEEGLKASPQGRALIRRLSAGPSSLPSSVHSTGPNSPRTSFNENGAAALDTASEDGGALSESLDGEQEVVSGMFYDMLQKEVVQLRKAKADQEQVLQDKEDAIEVRSLGRFVAFLLALCLSAQSSGVLLVCAGCGVDWLLIWLPLLRPVCMVYVRDDNSCRVCASESC